MPAIAYERIDHTADVGLRLTASTEAELFRAAAAGLNALWALSPARPAPDAPDESLAVSGPDVDALLVAWLNELIYQGQVEERAAAEVRNPVLSPPRFEARVVWQPVNWAEYPNAVDIKAATFHTVHVQPCEDGVSTSIVFNV